ncbi:COG4223 family protein [Acidisoma sp. 7E03]
MTPTPDRVSPGEPRPAAAPKVSAAPETAKPGASSVPPQAPRANGAPPSARPSAEPNRVTPLLTLAGFVILGGCVAYLWTRPVPAPEMPPIPPDQSGVVAALRGQVSNLQSSLASLDQRERQDVAQLRQQIAALPASGSQSGSAAPQPAPPAPAPDVSGDIARLKDQIAQLQQSAASATPAAQSLETLSGRVDSLAQREAGDSQSLRQTLTALQQQLGDLSDRTKSLAQQTESLPSLSAQSDRLAAVLRAEDALAAGKPLGSLADAPPALAAFATTAPPTEAQLRLDYPAAARAAEKAGGPAEAKRGFWAGAWQRVQNLVTLREGDRVIVGDQTSGILAHARRLLDAGDLSGAVTVLGTLQGPASQAMAPWMDQAKALTAARQALAEMAAH